MSRSLEERIAEHITDTKPSAHKHKKKSGSTATITLLKNTPSRDKNMLKSIEADEIHSYCTRFGNKMLNKRSIPKEKKQKKSVVAKFTIETEDALRERIDGMTEIKNDK